MCTIDMTLTAPACPVAGMMPIMVKDAVAKVEGVGLSRSTWCGIRRGARRT
jgi:metal-sulfur cluster biosynthetic enzyme